MHLNSVTSTLRLREYYYLVMRHRFYFVTCLVGSLFISILLIAFLPRTYRAVTVLLVKEEKILNPLISGLAISTRVSERMRTLREELLSWHRLNLLVEKLDLDQGVKGAYKFELLIQKLREHISIKIRGHDIITVRYEGPSPGTAQKIVQTLSDIIVEGSLTSQNLEANSAIRFIEEQLETYRVKLEKSEAELRGFKEVYNYTLPIATRMNDQLINLRMQLNQLMIDNTEEHPQVLKTKQQITQIEKQRDEQFELAKESGVDVGSGAYAKFVSSAPLQQQQMARLQRDYSVNNRIYESLLQRLQTAKISQTLEQSDKGTKFRVLEPARLPLRPIKPNVWILLSSGFLVGVCLGFGVVYLLESNNDTIRSLDEARTLFNLPILGSITTIRPENLLVGEAKETAYV